VITNAPTTPKWGMERNLRTKDPVTEKNHKSGHNEEEMVIEGAAHVVFRTGQQAIPSIILMTPDLTGLILAVDWLQSQGKFLWDSENERIKLSDGDWLMLRREKQARLCKNLRQRRYPSSRCKTNRSKCAILKACHTLVLLRMIRSLCLS